MASGQLGVVAQPAVLAHAPPDQELVLQRDPLAPRGSLGHEQLLAGLGR